MADVRQLLRAERASRRITHPHASYTQEGKLLCNLCETFVKSEAQWQSHLHSTQHTLRSQRAKEAADLRGAGGAGVGTKRKAEGSPEVEVEGDRKKARPDEDGDDDDGAQVASEGGVAEVHAEEEKRVQNTATNGITAPTQQQEQDSAADLQLDETELLAFERELAELESQPPSISALHAAATISAAPLTAEQLAAQASEEASAQPGRRDREVEEEREDAARVLEEEMEEMRGLEERVKRLRERREDLRRASGGREGGEAVDGTEGMGKGVELVNGVAVDDDDDDDEDYNDDWGFGGT